VKIGLVSLAFLAVSN